jgi:PrcB C-terminal
VSATVLLALAITLQTGSPVQTIARNMRSQVDAPAQVVARTPAEWNEVWRRHAPDVPPAVDFGTRTVVAVFLGARPTAGFAVEITAVREEGGVLIVEWRETKPSSDMILAQVVTSPVHIASIPQFAGEIKFQKVGP